MGNGCRRPRDVATSESSTESRPSPGTTGEEQVEQFGKGIEWTRESVIGHGSFGTVYLGVDKVTGEKIAVKEFPLSADDLEAFNNLQKEIEILRNLDHQNIIKYKGAEIRSDRGYIFLEYASGGTVKNLISERGKLPLPLVKQYSREILEGLAYLHRNNYVHRDIKASNLLIDGEGKVKLTDFGASNMITNNNGENSTLGTPHFMAPETLSTQKKLCPASDIWSFGCTVYEMFTGRIPFHELGKMEIIAKLDRMYQNSDRRGAVYLPTLPEGTPGDLVEFLELCFHIDPEERPTASSLASHPFLYSSEEESISLDNDMDYTKNISKYPRRHSILDKETMAIQNKVSKIRRSKSDRYNSGTEVSSPMIRNSELRKFIKDSLSEDFPKSVIKSKDAPSKYDAVLQTSRDVMPSIDTKYNTLRHREAVMKKMKMMREREA